MSKLANYLLPAAIAAAATFAQPAAFAVAAPLPGPAMAAAPSTPLLVEKVQYRGRYYRGGRGRGVGWGIGAGILGGAIIGSALAGRSYYERPYYSYPRTSYYYEPAPRYYAQPGGGEADAYCFSRFKSYDPRSGTYLGYDGFRHPCP